MAVDDVYRWSGTATLTNHTMMNTFCVRAKTTGDPSTADQQALADDFRGLINPLQSSEVSWYQWTLAQQWGNNMTIVASQCRREGGKQFSGLFTPPLLGGNTLTAPVAPQLAMVVTLQTGIMGRRKRGRLYFFGLCEDSQSRGLYESTVTGPMTTRLNTFFAKYGQGGTSPAFTIGVWSERIASGCVPNPNGRGHIPMDTPLPAQAFTPCIAYTLRNIVYTQRKRTYGVGG